MALWVDSWVSSSVVLSCQLGYTLTRANTSLAILVAQFTCVHVNCSETVTVWLKWRNFQVTFKTLGTAGDVGEISGVASNFIMPSFNSSMAVTAQADTQYSLFLLSQSPVKKISSCSRAILRLLELRSWIILLVFSLWCIDLSRLQDTCGEKNLTKCWEVNLLLVSLFYLF